MNKSNICLNIQSPIDDAYYSVDLFNISDIKVGLSILKFTQFNQPKSFSVSDVQIVANSQSDKVFGKQYRGDFDYTIISKTRYNCILLIDNNPIYGVLEINEIVHDPKNRTVRFKTSITGSRYLWINKISDRPLNQLDLGYMIFTTDLVQRSWDRFGTIGSRADTSLGDIPIPIDPTLDTGEFEDPDDGGAIYRDATFNHTPWTWRHDRDTHEGGFTFAPMHYGSWSMHLDPFDIDYPDQVVSGNFAIRVQDLRPSIYVKWVLTSIFEQWTDYTLVSKFVNTELFEGLILPHVSGDDWLPDLDDYEIIVGTTAPDMAFPPGTTGIFVQMNDEEVYNGYKDTLDLWNGVETYTTDRIIATKFIWEFELEDTDPQYAVLEANYTDIKVDLLVNNVLTQTVTIPINGRSFSTEDDRTTYASLANPSGFDYLTLAAGDQVKYQYYGFPVNGSNPNIGVPIVNMTYQNIVRKNIPADGIQIDLAPLLHPDLTVKSLLDGITHMFNLIVITDPINKIVRIEPDEASFLQGNRLVDWSSILDCGVEIVQKYDSSADPENIGGYTIKYKEDSADGFVEELQNRIGRPIYAQDVRLVPETDVFEAKDYKTYENPTFAATYFLRDWDTKANRNNLAGTSPPYWPRLWEEFEENTEGVDGLIRATPLYTGRDPKYSWLPRILYYNGCQWYAEEGVDTRIGFQYQRTGVSGSYITHYPFVPDATMVNYAFPSSYSLAFDSNNIDRFPAIRVRYVDQGNNEPNDVGLAPIYWNSYLRAVIYGSEVKIVVKVTPLELSEINFFDTIFISHQTLGNGLYRLGEVEEYNPVSQKALIQLIRIPFIEVDPLFD